MATINPEPQNEKEAVDESQVNTKLKKRAPLNLFLVFLIIGVAVYGVFLNFDKGRVLDRTSELEQETQEIQAEIDSIKDDKVEVSQNAAEALDLIEQDEIRWSEVISEIDKLLPQTATGGKLINVLSYSGSGQGRIAVNMVTLPKTQPPFEDVAQLILTFNSSVFFKDVYVPSIAKSSDESGGVTLSFVLNMDYEKPETGSEDFSRLELALPVDDSTKVPVPRAIDTLEEPVLEPAIESVETPAEVLEPEESELPDAPDAVKVPRTN